MMRKPSPIQVVQFIVTLLGGALAGGTYAGAQAAPPVVCPSCTACPEAVVDPLPVLPLTPSVAE